MNLSGPVWDFYRLMGAVLAANLLTVAFVWALMSYTRKEKEGTERTKGNLEIYALLLVFGFLGGSLFAAGFFDALLSN